MNFRLLAVLLSAAPVVASAAAPAPSIIAERVSKMVQTVKLERLTFGPDDNFQPAALGNSSEQILFVQKTHMNPQISIFDVRSRERRIWRNDLRDADQVEVGPNGSDVVFRSLDRSPDGEICVVRGLTESIQCLKLPAGEKSAPFWISKSKIGYLRKERAMSGFSLETYDLDRDQRAELNVDRLFHPSFDTKGQRLAWIEQIARQRSKQRINYALLTENGLGQRCSVELAWPGLSAYPKFSGDGSHLIFTHYLSDTNQDGRIDGSDNSLLARIPVSKDACPNPGVIPEPLTSLAENCSQPNVSGESLIVACAFEGSLDLYRLPQTGVIPVNWGEKELLSAVVAARSPEDRLLFMHSLFAKGLSTGRHLMRGFFAQHLLMDDDSGAIEWLDKMKTAGVIFPAEASIFDKLLQAVELRKTEPPGQLSLPLRQNLERRAKELAGAKPTFLSTVAQARIFRLMGQGSTAQAKTLLQSLSKQKAPDDIAFLLYSREWELLSEQTAMDETLYQQSLRLAPLRPESQLIYWSKSLARLPTARPNRDTLLASLKDDHLLPNDVRTLIEFEMLAMKVARKEDQAYLNFDKVLSRERDKSLLVRLAAYRAIQLWTQFDQLKEVEFITSNLLKFIPSPSLEWTYARDYFIATAFDRAYEYVAAQNSTAALGHFYGAVTLTDDLEAHWGYLTNMIAAGREGLIDRNIDELTKRRFLTDNEALVRLYAELARRKFALPEDPEGWLKTAENVQKISHPFAEFLRGSVRLQWVLESPSMKEDQVQSQLEIARQELVLALDGARDNLRLKAQTLTNLGILGSRAKLWGPAQKWWQERLELPFATEIERQLAIYLRAQALISLQDFQQASQILSQVNVPSGSELEKPFTHLRVQAAAYSGDHEAVIRLTTATTNPFESMNDLRLGLLQGRSYLRLGQNPKACQVLGQVDQKLQPMSAEIPNEVPKGNTVKRLQILTAGFLSQCGGREALQQMHHYQRLLNLEVDEQKRLALEEVNFLELRLKNQLRLWIAQGDLDTQSVGDFIKDVEAHRAEAGQFVTLGQFQSLYGLGSLALVSPTKPTAEQLGEIITRIDSFTNSAKLALARSDLLISQRLKLEALRMKLDGGTGAQLSKWREASADLKELKDRNAFLAKQTEESLEWMEKI